MKVGFIMKKLFKWIGAVVFFAVALFSIIKLILLIKKYSLFEVLMASGKLDEEGVGVVEISKNGTKFLTKAHEEGAEAFKDYLNSMGYNYIGRFGSSNLYEYEGVEIVVKRSRLLGKYYLYEIFNEDYFGEANEYLLD